jgi:hypothetical protein
MVKLILLSTAVLLAGAIAASYWSYRRASSDAESAMASIAARAATPVGSFDEGSPDDGR